MSTGPREPQQSMASSSSIAPASGARSLGPPPTFRFTAWPTEFRTVTQWFGNDPAYYGQFGLAGHEGIDFVAPTGSHIFAVAPGVVKMVHPSPTGHNYGTHVRVLHDQGYQTIYAHLESLAVGEGQTVQAGDVLGLADHTGNCNGDHLHLTLKHDGESLAGYPNNIIDPTPFLAPLLNAATDGAAYVTDVVPDGSSYPCDDSFSDTWRLRNTGTSAWGPGYALAFSAGDALGAPASVPLPTAQPGEEVEVTVTFRAPESPGHFRSTWRCRNAAGVEFGEPVWVDILVVAREYLPVTQNLGVRDKLGIDANAPIDAATGAISARMAEPAIVSAMGQGWVRVNFIMGPWQNPLDGTLHAGRTWVQTYRAIIDALRSQGLRIYGLINHEAVHDGPGRQFRNPPPDGEVSNDWIHAYVETFYAIVRLFQNRVDVFESFNEPDNWTQVDPGDWDYRRNWIHPEWFAIMLQEIWERVRTDPQTVGVKLVSGPLLGIDTGSGACTYLQNTYEAGKRRYGWGQNGVPFPFDGIGCHLYIAQNPANPEAEIQARYNQVMHDLRQVIALEEARSRPIVVSEIGWPEAAGEARQAECMRAGLRCILDDPNVALGIWFCLQDWGDLTWGLYRAGGLGPDQRKPAYGMLQQVCADMQPVRAAAWSAPAAVAVGGSGSPSRPQAEPTPPAAAVAARPPQPDQPAAPTPAEATQPAQPAVPAPAQPLRPAAAEAHPPVSSPSLAAKETATGQGAASVTGRQLGAGRPLWLGALQAAVFVALLGVVAFVAAGTLDWLWAWLFLVTYLALLVLTPFLVRDPELLAERSRSGEGLKRWDRFFATVPALFMVIILVVSGLDAGRFDWSPALPLAVHLAAWLVLVLAFVLTLWAMRTNTFFSRVLRIQADRGHQVVSNGPYAYVRHPGYVGMFALGIAMPLLLGSLWALVPGALQIALMIVRTGLEDRTLQAELPGYRDYAARVRYRLIPGIW